MTELATPYAKRLPVIQRVVNQHVDDAAFLWELRDLAVRRPDFDLGDLAKLDDRLEAHLDGLRISGDAADDLIWEKVVKNEPGAVFVSAFRSVEANDLERTDVLVRRVLDSDPELRLERPLVSAFVWAGLSTIPSIRDFLSSHERCEVRKWFLRGVAAERFVGFGELGGSLEIRDAEMEAAKNRGLGELGCVHEVAACLARIEAEQVDIRLWSAWSATLLGSSAALPTLREVSTSSFRHAPRALQLAGRAMPRNDSLSWHRELAARPEHLRHAIQLAGAIGDPSLLPWLLDQMANEEMARVAGESFSTISGLDLAYEGLDQDQPEGFEAGPNDDPEDENVEMDEDENLPWPNVERLTAWYESNVGRFDPARRYLVGHPIGPDRVDGLVSVLKEGTQRQRAAAALEMALADPGKPLFETRACGLQQQAALGLPLR